MKSVTSWLSLISISTLLAACSSTPVAPPEPPKPAPTASADQTPGATPQAAPASTGTSAMLHLDPTSNIAKQRSVYFDFDDFSIKKNYTELIEMHGKYLAARPAVAIRIEGNADERGSAEYNLSLGQRRAEAVLNSLAIYGAKVSQMEPVSFGEEHPKTTGHDEADWAQNRRADLDYPKK